MIFTPTELAGVFVIELERLADERGFFARTWCAEEFAKHGLTDRFVQSNISYSKTAGTLRGMHWQDPPHAEAKLIRVTTGAIHDVVVDLRPGSATYARHVGVRLEADSQRMLYVPEGFAHGFLTLVDDTEVTYQMSAFYAPQAARGARWDDSLFGIDWPGEVHVISERDATYPDLAA